MATTSPQVKVPPRGSPSVARAVAILTVMSDRPSGWTLTQLAAELGLAKSSTLSIMTSLESSGYVTRNGNEYVLDLGVLRPAAGFLRGLDITETFKNSVTSCTLLRHEIAHLAVLSGTQVTFIARHVGRQPLPVTGLVGDRFPASITAVGLALLAELTDEQVIALYSTPDAAFPRWTSQSTRSLDELLTKLAGVRERGYSIDDGETHPGVLGLGVVVHHAGNLTQDFAMSSSLVREGLTDERREQALAEIMSVRDRLQTFSQLD